MKSPQDVESYNNEFNDLQEQLFQISEQTFNGASLFARFQESNSVPILGNEVKFKGTTAEDHTLTIYTSDNGSSGTVISINRSSFLSALTLTNDLSTKVAVEFGTTASRHTGTGQASTNDIVSFAAENIGDVIDLDAVSMGMFEKALENIAYLRAEAGGSMSRLNFAADSIASYTANMRAAVGRIEDVDIALESSNLAKYSILSQASAAMIAQANSSNDVALMLVR